MSVKSPFTRKMGGEYSPQLSPLAQWFRAIVLQAISRVFDSHRGYLTRYNSVVEYLIHIQVVKSSILFTGTTKKFVYLQTKYGTIAHLVEHSPEERGVVGSIPTGTTIQAGVA